MLRSVATKDPMTATITSAATYMGAKCSLRARCLERSRCWYKATSRRASCIAKTGLSFCVSQIACRFSNSMAGLLSGFARKVCLDAVDLHPHVVLRDAEHRRHFLVAEPVQQQQRQGPVDLVQLPNLLVEPLDPRIRRRGLENGGLHSIQPLFPGAMSPLFLCPRDGRIQ